jgi:hypothetical protein
LENADFLLPLAPNWQSWKSFFNDISSEVFSHEDVSKGDISNDHFVTPTSKVWMQYSYLSSLRDTLAQHFQKGTVSKWLHNQLFTFWGYEFVQQIKDISNKT